MKKRLIAVLLTLALVMSFPLIGNAGKKDDYIRLSGKNRITSSSTNFALKACGYMEYMAAHFHDRGINPLTSKKAEMRKYIISELKKAGYEDKQIEKTYAGPGGKNIVLTVEGKDTSKQIIVGAHYDGDGDGDNISGTALLLAEAVGLHGRKLPFTVKYIFFDNEEVGSIGAMVYSAFMSEEEIKSTVYMVNMDSLAFGDYCCIYGGVQNDEEKTVTATGAYKYAMKAAKKLGYNVYDTNYLDGYYARNGKGPRLDRNGVFTNPWTYENPAPANAETMSPSTLDASDHAPFHRKGIEYIYFEATNWFASGGKINGSSYTGYYETMDTSIGKNGMFMNTEYDTIENLEKYFPGRAAEHFNIYSPILSSLLISPPKK